ncbi:metal-dependent transcriptional regulator [Actinomycetospora straminea]|nr:metal-dependent transcriptional regulator [Actinomycetospora straminea]MDD7932189.1 metal-dependent transcriptional regulator [Actinomycetospora straminea]
MSGTVAPRTAAVDDYIKAIYAVYERGEGPASTTALARRLGVGASSVSGMLRKLTDQGLVEHRPYGGVRLTDSGTRAALDVLRRHRLLETYLVRELGYGWDEVHDEAEVLEHHVSPTLLDRMDERLGHPRYDPHGDPIPAADGTVAEFTARRFATLEPGDRGRLVRVDDTEPAMLTWLREQAIELGVGLELVARRPFGGPFEVRVGAADGERDLDLGPELADALWVDDVVEGVFHRGSAS